MAAKNKRRTNQQYVWYLFLLPTLAGIVLFMAYPVSESFRLSFYNSNGTIERWVGLFNYQRIFTSPQFWYAVFTTFYVAFFQLLIAIPLGFLIASLINEVTFGKNVLKVIYFIPYVTSIVAAAMIFLFVLHPGQGLLNHLLSLLGLPNSAWLAEPASARWGVIILAVWHSLGFIIIICLANLQAIALELYEAAMIDGASKVQQWRYITIPQMKGCFAFLIVMGWITGISVRTGSLSPVFDSMLNDFNGT